MNNYSIEEIISEDFINGQEIINKQNYYFKYVKSFIPSVKNKIKYFKLFHDDFRQPLTLQEMLLFNAIRHVKAEYCMNYRSSYFLLSREKSYSQFMNLLSSIEKKGYIYIKEIKKYTIFNKHIIHNRRDSEIEIKCINQWGQVI